VKKVIFSRAPTRIDLAGGTLDIWPLYHLFNNPPTVNAAINLFATVKITPLRGKTIRVNSKDLNLNESFSSINKIPLKHPLELILRTIQFYKPKTGFTIETDCEAPPGSGIGGSSSLSIALNGALNRFTGKKLNRSQILTVAQNIETQVISVPTGWQDYYPALYGGFLSLRSNMLQIEVEKIKVNLVDLTHQFTLCYTGKPRKSGINNWEVFRKTIEGNKKVVNNLEKIGDNSRKISQTLIKGNLQNLPSLLKEEWISRKKLAPGIVSPEINRIATAAQKAGALAAKVCGAGGGGCVAFMSNKENKNFIRKAIEKEGARFLDFKFVKNGLEIKEHNSN
jgi:D-glycero-alpha-D-manno-heptose-7-phosphate kinase